MTDDAPLDRPLRDLLAAYDPTKSDDALTRDGVLAAFATLHPADAGRLVRDIGMAMDEGYTAQGSRHPDFQTYVSLVKKDAYDRQGGAPDG